MIKTLRPDNEQYIYEQVKAGRFATPEAVVDAAIDDMRNSAEDPIIECVNIDDLDDDEIDDDLRASIEEARAQFDRGEGIPFEEVKAYWQKKLHGT
jgi:hypothetical protein